ncbi:MAG TPA: hypothetical protein VI365_12075 [Trebonia sp.]
MAVHGAVCDTVIVVFTDHASAIAYASDMIRVGQLTGSPAAEVVGPNWVVNTGPGFAGKVIKAVGGQLITESAAVATTPAAATPAAPASPTPGPATQVHFVVTGRGNPSVTFGSDSDSRSPAGGYGPLGDGVALPFNVSGEGDFR